MLLFFIYAALGVELFGRLGECGHSGPLPEGDAGPREGGSCVCPTPRPQVYRVQGTGLDQVVCEPSGVSSDRLIPCSPLILSAQCLKQVHILTPVCTDMHTQKHTPPPICVARDHTQASQAGSHSRVNMGPGGHAHTSTYSCLALNIVPEKVASDVSSVLLPKRSPRLYSVWARARWELLSPSASCGDLLGLLLDPVGQRPCRLSQNVVCPPRELSPGMAPTQSSHKFTSNALQVISSPPPSLPRQVWQPGLASRPHCAPGSPFAWYMPTVSREARPKA